VIPEANADFVCQMEKVLAVYELPYDEKSPVVCLDESPKQLIKEGFTDSQGVQYEDYEYVCKGAVDIYVVCEPLAGKREFFCNGKSYSQTVGSNSYLFSRAEVSDRRNAHACAR
jgi:hypothetical protein